MLHRFQRIDASWFVLSAIIALGLFLRVYGLNWDQGVYLHPDERFIAMVSSERVNLPGAGNLGQLFDPAHSPINPRRDDPGGAPLSFAYGSLPIYVQSIASWAVGLVTDTDYQAYPHVYRVGRALNAVLDSLTILFAFLIGRRLFGRSAGLVAAALYALAVLPIQLSHFFTVDIWLTLFVTASLYFAIRYVDKPTMNRAVALAIPVGFAFATKASVPSLIVPLLVMAGWTVWRAEYRRQAIANLAAAGVLAVAVFSIFEPYAIVRMGPFIQDIRTQADIVRGTFDVPFTRQFVGLTPGVYELRNLFLYGLGPAFLLAGLGGVVFGVVRSWRLGDPALLIVVSWVFAYVPTLLITEARFLRYSLPLVPVFAVLAAGLLLRPLVPGWPRLSRIALTSVLVITAIWAFGFSSIYSKENPRIAASKWMVENIPPGSAVTAEYWDDALPLAYPGSPPVSYPIVSFDLYADLPPEQKAAYIAQTLQSTDYVVLSSDRVIDSVDNLPWRYAVQNEYYRRLTAGQLGFQLVYEAQLQPELFGIRYNDAASDESFTVYDHPHVRIFKKVDALSTAEIRDRLLWGVQQDWTPSRYPPEKPLSLGEPVGEIMTTDDTGWNASAVDHASLAILVWLIVVEVIGLAALPLAATVLGRSPDRGIFSARLMGLLTLGWIGWVAGSTGLWESRSANIAIALAVVFAASWWLVSSRWRSGRPLLLPTRRMYLASLALWLGVFGFFLLLRAIYPDFWQTWFGGEKPFELAYLHAVSRSVEFPPYDPWYADGIINYYYYGWHLLATVIKLSGVGVSYGFQLGSATFAGLFGLQVAALGALLGSGARARRASAASAAGAVAVVATLFVGNLDGLRQVVEQGVPADTFDFWRSTRVIDFTINEFPYFSQVWADVHPHVINFPIVALLLTLLAAIVLSGPWPGLTTVLPAAVVVALTLGSAVVTNAWDGPLAAGLTVATFGYVGWRRSWRYGITGVMFGMLIVGVAFVLFLPFHRGFYSVVQGVNLASDGSPLGQFLTVWGMFFGIVAITIAADWSRHAGWRASMHDGSAFGMLALVAGAAAGGLNIVRDGSLPHPPSIAALLLFTALVAMASAATRVIRRPMLFVVPLIVLTVIGADMAFYRPAASVALAITLAASMYVLFHRRRPSRLLPWAFIAIGSVTIAATEFVYVADDLQRSDWERMNTVFKFYLQAWTLLAVGTAILLVRLWQVAAFPGARLLAHGPALGFIARPIYPPRAAVLPAASSRRAARVAAGLAALLLAAGLVYPLAGTPARLSWNMPTTPKTLSLDGYAWMNGGSITNGTGEVIDFTGDRAAIQWLRSNVDGSPVILEASIGPYRGNGSRISSATGLPAVLGWDRHQRQQRYLPGIDRRMNDVRAIYNETDPARKLESLRRYGVRYAVVGDVERYWNTPEAPAFYASPEGLAAFDALLGNGLELVFESGNTRVYEVVDFPHIPPAKGAVHLL